jgi:hypothetical protein
VNDDWQKGYDDAKEARQYASAVLVAALTGDEDAAQRMIASADDPRLVALAIADEASMWLHLYAHRDGSPAVSTRPLAAGPSARPPAQWSVSSPTRTERPAGTRCPEGPSRQPVTTHGVTG